MMIEQSKQVALSMLKIRLNRADNNLDAYLLARLDAEIGRFVDNGIVLTDTTDDIMLLVDMAAWAYGNREQHGHMPEWLRLARRERWLKEGRDNDT